MGMFMYVVIDMAIACGIVYAMSFVIDSSAWGEVAFRTVPFAVWIGNISRDVDSIIRDDLIDSVIGAQAACQE